MLQKKAVIHKMLFSISFFFFMFVFLGCNQTAKKTVETSGETKTGTPIVDHEKSSFSIWDVNMIETPNSSCFSQIGYSNEYEILVVTFRDSESTYLYLNVPKSEWESFRNAESLGSYFNTNIKSYYECNKYE